MGQRKGSKKSSVATVDNTTHKSKTEVTPLHPVSKPTPSAKTTATVKPNGPTHEQIAQRAHELWVRNGSKHGEDQHYWLEAEAQLKKEMGIK